MRVQSLVRKSHALSDCYLGGSDHYAMIRSIEVQKVIFFKKECCKLLLPSVPAKLPPTIETYNEFSSVQC